MKIYEFINLLTKKIHKWFCLYSIMVKSMCTPDQHTRALLNIQFQI